MSQHFIDMNYHLWKETDRGCPLLMFYICKKSRFYKKKFRNNWYNEI